MNEMSKGDFIKKAVEEAKSTAGSVWALLAIRVELKELKEAILGTENTNKKSEVKP